MEQKSMTNSTCKKCGGNGSDSPCAYPDFNFKDCRMTNSTIEQKAKDWWDDNGDYLLSYYGNGLADEIIGTEAYKAGYNEAAKWISVNSGKPDEHKPVIAYSKTMKVLHYAFFHDGTFWDVHNRTNYILNISDWKYIEPPE